MKSPEVSALYMPNASDAIVVLMPVSALNLWYSALVSRSKFPSWPPVYISPSTVMYTVFPVSPSGTTPDASVVKLFSMTNKSFWTPSTDIARSAPTPITCN